MLLYSAFLVFILQFLTIQCLIPSLTVRKLDRKVIERKRQDTLDMCRIFNTENEKLKKISVKYKQPTNNYGHSQTRLKREIDPNKLGNPSLSSNDVKRVENIVDKLYEDMQEKDVTYRQKDLSSLTTPKPLELNNKTLRRFNFAPGELLGGIGEEKTAINSPPEPVTIPWIKHWKHAIIPYFIDSNTYDVQLAEEITKAFDYFEKATCIRLQRLRERPTDKDSLQNVEWLYITNPTGIRQCVHSNERKANKGVQMVVFGYDCLSLGQIVHEIMHNLGFSHEHTRPDRDHHISILWDNIKPGYKKYFEVHEQNALTSIPYDYASILHYPPRAFSKNGKVTVLAEVGVKLGQREGLSEYDVEKINMIFGSECVERNKDYLITTCPRAVRADTRIKNVTQEDVQSYFKNRLWPFGIINYKLRDKLEFSIEERENIQAVIRHIEKETCLEFRDLTENTNDEKNDEYNSNLSVDPLDKNSFTDKKVVSEDEPTNDNVNFVTDTENKKNLVNEVTENEDANESLGNHEALKDQHIPIDGSSPNEETAIKNDVDSDVNKPNLRTRENGKTTQKIQNKSNGNLKRVRRAAKRSVSLTSSRRHAASIVTITRSPTPGCRCPAAGRPNGNIQLEINADCFNSINDLLHFFVHVLGLDHQHNMYDRDSYIHILWDNLSPEIKSEMRQLLPPAASVGFSYDYQSVMHYPWLQIKNGKTNMMYPVWNDGWAMGHWQGLSSIDVQKLNLLYFQECHERKKQTQSATNSLRHQQK